MKKKVISKCMRLMAIEHIKKTSCFFLSIESSGTGMHSVSHLLHFHSLVYCVGPANRPSDSSHPFLIRNENQMNLINSECSSMVDAIAYIDVDACRFSGSK